MNIEKLNIPEEKLQNNFLFYLFLKEMNSTNGLKSKEIKDLLSSYALLYSNALPDIISDFITIIEKLKNQDKQESMIHLLTKITNESILSIYVFALKLMQVKPLLLEEAKICEYIILEKSSKLHPLSIGYDEIGKHGAYYIRVNGALISLLFFDKLEKKENNFLSTNAENYIIQLSNEYNKLQDIGVEANQIFMLMFSESMNQSIKSDSGSSYENRILNVLNTIGIKKDAIQKKHDESDKSIEYDFFFKIEGRSFGISAKRTLRERYKQFLKKNIDVLICITLGLDLTKDKAITHRENQIYLFVADEIYNSRSFLQNLEGVYPASLLSLELLKSLH